MVVTAEPNDNLLRIVSARFATKKEKKYLNNTSWGYNMDEIPELTDKDFKHSIPFKTRRRLIAGKFNSGKDISALRNFIGLTQDEFAKAIGISVHTLRNWEQGRRRPDGAAIGLLRIAARHPRIIKENLSAVA